MFLRCLFHFEIIPFTLSLPIKQQTILIFMHLQYSHQERRKLFSVYPPTLFADLTGRGKFFSHLQSLHTIPMDCNLISIFLGKVNAAVVSVTQMLEDVCLENMAYGVVVTLTVYCENFVQTTACFH